MKQPINRSIGPVSLLFTALGSIIGSGWLFGAWHASKIAGPAAIVAWIIGAVIVMALVFYRWGVRSGLRTAYLRERAAPVCVDPAGARTAPDVEAVG